MSKKPKPPTDNDAVSALNVIIAAELEELEALRQFEIDAGKLIVLTTTADQDEDDELVVNDLHPVAQETREKIGKVVERRIHVEAVLTIYRHRIEVIRRLAVLEKRVGNAATSLVATSEAAGKLAQEASDRIDAVKATTEDRLTTLERRFGQHIEPITNLERRLGVLEERVAKHRETSVHPAQVERIDGLEAAGQAAAQASAQVREEHATRLTNLDGRVADIELFVRAAQELP